LAEDSIAENGDGGSENASENLSKNETKNLGSVNNSKNTYGGQNEEKNNPWFWGNMALSALSLYLVWRYQILKKQTK